MTDTPEPWEAKKNADGSWVVMSSSIVIATFRRRDHPQWNKVHARLIAAAPDLLAAIEELVEGERRDNTLDPDITFTDAGREEAWRTAERAIAKARGNNE